MTVNPWLPWERRPLSVVVLGNSVPLMQVPPRQRHGEGTYAETLADSLQANGIPVILQRESSWFELANEGARRARTVIARHSPDVLIVHYGVNEMLPWLMPLPVMRHLMRRHESLRRTTRAYRKHIGEPAWQLAKRYRKWASPKVGLHTWTLTPYRFRASLDLIINQAAYATAPLVLVVDITPPSESLSVWLPGIDARHRVFQQILSDAVTAADSRDVRLVAASTVSDKLGRKVATPDTIHWTPEAHAMVGDLLSSEVLSWLAEGGHR